ncbi:MAG: hypothetical protein H6711_28350 [Myxococcales bacterium]|nr:hypothetical protein [Myxococcales bacterium]
MSIPSRVLLLALLAAGCARDPEVIVSTRVGAVEPGEPPTEALADQVDAYRQWLGSMPGLSIIALDEDDDGEAAAGDDPRPRKDGAKAKARKKKRPKPAVSLPPPPPPTTDEELRRQIVALRETPVDNLALPASSLTLTEAGAWTALREALLAPRQGRKADYKALLDKIGGDVPNRYGHFERSWKREHGYDVRLSEDWYGDLLALAPASIPRSLHAIYRDCVLEAALLRATAAIGQAEPALVDEVVDTLLEAAYIHEGTFRDEVGRALRAIGDPAIPELVRRSERPPIKKEEDRFETAYRQAEYAEYQLDALDRLQPRRAVAGVVDNPHLLAALLDAYGQRRVPEAAEVILDHVESPLPRVRRAARDAFLAYVSGPAPAAERKTLRLLGGKTSTAKAGLTYRDAAARAIRERLGADAPDLVEEPCSLYLPEGAGRDPACEAQPERHTHAYLALLDARKAEAEEAVIVDALARAELDETIAELDRLLVANPERMADGRVIDAYRRAAESALAGREHGRAGQLLRKTAMLIAGRDPEGQRTLTIQALLAEAANEELSPEGRAMLLTTAEALAPDDPDLHAAVTELRRQSIRFPAPSPLRLAGGLAILAMMLLLLSTLGARTGPWLARRRESVAAT